MFSLRFYAVLLGLQLVASQTDSYDYGISSGGTSIEFTVAVVGDENPSLVVNTGSYQGSWGVLSEGANQFSDRSYVLTSVPAHLLGATYFEGPCHSQGASLTVSTSGTLYILSSHGNSDSKLNQFVFAPEPQSTTTIPMHTTSFWGDFDQRFEEWKLGAPAPTTTGTTTTSTLGPLCGVFSCGDDAMLIPLMNTEVGSNFDTCCECSYAASNHAFLGMFMKGEFDNQSRKLSLSFDLPSDVQIQSVDWNGASNDTLSYASGLWTSSTVSQCRNTYILNEDLAHIFGGGSLFSLLGTTLTTSIRVIAISEITKHGSTFNRSYSEDIPILVGLETETTVQATFHMTMTTGELVDITGNAEHYATDGTVKLTMMVTTPGCIENAASIASGMQHLTDPEFTFGEENLVDNLCEQEVTLTFNPIEEFADQISIQFTSRQGVDFQIEVDVNIQAGSILDYLPFDAVMTFHAEPTFSDDPQAEFLLGAEVYAKIELSPLVNLPLSSITVNSFTLTQTGYSGELETTDLMNEGWAGFNYTTTPEQNKISAEFELESTHFHVTEEGELCEVDTDISIVYQDGTTVRRQLSMRRRLTTQQVSNGFAIAEAVESESMVAQILKQTTPATKTFFIFASFFTGSILIFRVYTATKQDEYASLLSADYDEF